MRWWILLLVGGLSYLLFFLAYLPAQQAMAWLMPENSPIEIGGTQGTLWKGSAKRTLYQGVELGSSDWRFMPTSLLLGRLKYAIDLEDKNQKIHADAALNLLNGDYLLSNLKGSITAASLASVIGQPFVDLGGTLDIDIELMQFSNRQISAAMGSLRWMDAEINKPIQSMLGNLQFELSGDENLVQTQINDIDGPLAVDGVVELLPDGRYRINGQVKPRNGSDPGLVNLLRNIGRAESDGGTRIEYSGQL
jgi:hypothetical protein